jgi:hypothetical protein
MFPWFAKPDGIACFYKVRAQKDPGLIVKKQRSFMWRGTANAKIASLLQRPFDWRRMIVTFVRQDNDLHCQSFGVISSNKRRAVFDTARRNCRRSSIPFVKRMDERVVLCHYSSM